MCTWSSQALALTCDGDCTVVPGATRSSDRAARRASYFRCGSGLVRTAHHRGARGGVGESAGDLSMVAGVVGVVATRPRSVAAAGDAQSDYVAAAYVRPGGCPGGSAHDLIARGHRRFAQLGLPLCLAARRRHRDRCLSGRWASRGGARVPVLVAARDPVVPAAAARTADLGRPARAGGAAARLAWVRRKPAGAGRQ